MKTTWLTLGALLAIAACTTEVTVEDDGGTGGSGGTTVVVDPLCAPFVDEVSTAEVEITFVNESDRDIYVPGNCSKMLFELEPLTGDDDLAYRYDSSCLQTCEDLMTDSAIQCGACQPSSYLIPAFGGTYTTKWRGDALDYGQDMPASCYLDPEQGQGFTCPVRKRAAAQAYRISATGFDSCSNCECNGSECIGDPAGLEAWTDGATLEYPSDNTISVTFGVCAFGCAGDQ